MPDSRPVGQLGASPGSVTVQHGTHGRHTRFAYCIRVPGEPVFVSDARWSTPEAALAAGERDRDACLPMCNEFIEVAGDSWAGTYCKLLAGHDGPCSPHYPEAPDA